jgi:hypothetical protein
VKHFDTGQDDAGGGGDLKPCTALDAVVLLDPVVQVSTFLIVIGLCRTQRWLRDWSGRLHKEETMLKCRLNAGLATVAFAMTGPALYCKRRRTFFQPIQLGSRN